MVKISATLMKQLNKQPKDHKYGAKRTTCLHGHNHDSKKEAMWCVKLHQLHKEDKIYNLQLQPKFELKVNDIHIADHYPDFYYETFEMHKTVGASITLVKQYVAEVKGDWEGSRLPVWKLKKKLFDALYPEIDYQVV